MPKYHMGGGNYVATGLNNEDQASALHNATSPGDAGNRADHFLGASLDPKWSWQGTPSGWAYGSSVVTAAGPPAGVHLIETYTPSGAFRVEARLAAPQTGPVGLVIRENPGYPTGIETEIYYHSNAVTFNYYAPSSTTVVGQISVGTAAWYYLAIERDGSNNVTGAFSIDRVGWTNLGTFNLAIAVAVLSIDISTTGQLVSADFVDVVS